MKATPEIGIAAVCAVRSWITTSSSNAVGYTQLIGLILGREPSEREYECNSRLLRLIYLHRSPSKVFDTYWRFAAERQEIFFRRIAAPALLDRETRTPEFKFTNAYRASESGESVSD